MIAVVVGTGYTGRRLLGRLPAGEAVGLSRSMPRPEPAARIEIVDLDRDEKPALELPRDYSVVYTVPPAAEAGAEPESPAADPRLGRLLGHLLPPPSRFVYLSTTGVYGNRNGAVVDEETEPKPETGRAGRRLAVERRLASWCGDNGSKLIVLRVPGIYGPGRLGVDRLRAGEPVLAEAEANPGNRIHVDDLVECCIAALCAGVPAGIYNLGDGDRRTSTWFAAEVARQAGLPPPPTVDREEAERRFSARRLSFLAESRRVDTRKMRDVLGVTPSYTDAADGIRASLLEENP